MRSLALYLLYVYYKIRYMYKVKFNGFTVLYAFKNSQILVGNGTSINSSSMSNMLGLYQRTIIVARYGGKISIGRNCGISGTTIYSMVSIIIGDNCAIGANCKIVDNDFHPLDKEHRRLSLNKEHAKRRPVVIGDDCFIGMNSIILKGTKLGNNVIVGAGSVVSGNFPDNIIIAGNPAKIIRSNI